MNDPPVVSLHYSVEPGPDGPTYDNPPPVAVPKPEFDLELREGRAVAMMTIHYSTVDDARLVVDAFLKAWETETALNSDGRPRLQFRFQEAKVIDRNPPPHDPSRPILGSANIFLGGLVTLEARGQITAHQYPSPPTIRMNADVETFWFRYSLYKDGRDSLTGMAYFCLTTLEGLGGGRKAAAQRFGIASAVLNTLARLASAVGDGTTARKWSKAGEARPHTQKEVEWIDAAIRALIRRVGEHTAGVTPLRQLTMADLPPLE